MCAMLRLTAGLALPLLQLLFHAVDATIDLIDALAVLLSLAGSSLSLSERLALRPCGDGRPCRRCGC